MFYTDTTYNKCIALDNDVIDPESNLIPLVVITRKGKNKW